MNGNIYKHIAMRTGGNIYIGVVGPVRTGKSTFVKRFMDLLVIPNIDDKTTKNRVIDSLPLSGDGKTITTTETKFVPEEGIEIFMSNGLRLNVRIVDSVGFLIPDVYGFEEDGKARMVKTPWSNEEISLKMAAEISTEKVIKDHSSIGIIILSDGSVTNIPREDYLEAEKETIRQLKEINKPFIAVLNTKEPKNTTSIKIAEEIAENYDVCVYPCNVEKMTIDDIENIFDKILMEFPIREINLDLPKYFEALPMTHSVKGQLIEQVLNWMNNAENVGEIENSLASLNGCTFIQSCKIKEKNMATGKVTIQVLIKDGLYYEIIGEILKNTVKDEKDLFLLLKEYSEAKFAYDQFSTGLKEVDETGYGIVSPKLGQMTLGQPEVFKHGNKYGVRLKAKAPCIHIIKTEVTTEVSPVVGSKEQSEDLCTYLQTQFGEDETKIWETNLFGKTIEELICQQLDAKLTSVPEELQHKIIKSLQKISDGGKDYFICIIL